MLAKTDISAAELQEVAERIKSLRKQATEHAVEIGRELLRIKATLPHGVFVKWVEKQCEFKIRTAQDLMKLAREVDSNAQLVALMVPSTLRVYLAKSTPPAVRQMVLTRLENGERVSRNHLTAAKLEARSRRAPNSDRAMKSPPRHAIAVPDLLTAGDTRDGSEIYRARKVAGLIFQRLHRDDYELIMDGMNWGIWNRVLVWLRAARTSVPEPLEPAVVPRVANS